MGRVAWFAGVAIMGRVLLPRVVCGLRQRAAGREVGLGGVEVLARAGAVLAADEAAHLIPEAGLADARRIGTPASRRVGVARLREVCRTGIGHRLLDSANKTALSAWFESRQRTHAAMAGDDGQGGAHQRELQHVPKYSGRPHDGGRSAVADRTPSAPSYISSGAK
eukprot:737530-Prymnesium_polylepis.2